MRVFEFFDVDVKHRSTKNATNPFDGCVLKRKTTQTMVPYSFPQVVLE